MQSEDTRLMLDKRVLLSGDLPQYVLTEGTRGHILATIDGQVIRHFIFFLVIFHGINSDDYKKSVYATIDVFEDSINLKELNQ